MWKSLVCCSLLWPLGAAAQPTVAWQAPRDCPTASQARTELSHLLRKKLSDMDVELALLVRIEGSAATGFEASVVTRGGGSTRERVLRDARCDVLTHAVAVVCALAIDPAATVPERERPAARSALAEPAQAGRSAGSPPAAPAELISGTPPAASGAAAGAATSAAAGAAIGAANSATAGAATGAATSATAGAATSATATAAARTANNATTTAANSATTTAAARAATDASNGATADPARRAADSVQGTATASQSAAERAATEQSAEDAATAEAPSEAAAHAAEPEPVQDGAARLAVVLSAGGGALVGVLPQLAPEVSAAVSVLGERWRASVRLAYAAAQHATLEVPAGAGGRVSLASAAVDGGLRWHGRWVEVPLLIGLETGFFMADAEGVDSHSQGIAGWLASYLGSGVSVALGPSLAVGLRAEGLIALLRPRFAVESSTGMKQVFFRPAALGGRLFLELEVRLP